MTPTNEALAAIGLAMGGMPERQYAIDKIGFGKLYRVMAEAAETFQKAVAEEVAWGEEADWVQTLHNYAARILEAIKKRGKEPTKEHLKTLARESVYYFLEPKFPSPLSKEERDQILGLLVSGFEGGISYWAQVVDVVYPPGTTAKDFKEGGKMQLPGEYYHWAELVPIYPGGAVILRDLEESPDPMERQLEEMRVRAEKAKRGMKRYFTGEEPEGPEPKDPEIPTEERAGWTTYKIDLPAIQKAWNLLKMKYPKVYQRVVDESYDALDGDVFIQLAAMGEVVYG